MRAGRFVIFGNFQRVQWIFVPSGRPSPIPGSRGQLSYENPGMRCGDPSWFSQENPSSLCIKEVWIVLRRRRKDKPPAPGSSFPCKKQA